MESPQNPADEQQRLEGLEALNIVDTPAEERFDRLTRMAKALFHVPIALVSLVDENRQWFKSKQGLNACSTDREISFCGHAILEDEVFWVEDASKDVRFHDNPLVVGAPFIRFYAGRPLKARNGKRVGTLCVIDTHPRPVSQEDIRMLNDLGHTVENELNAMQLGSSTLEFSTTAPLERRERIDGITGCWNALGMREVLDLGLVTCEKTEQSAGVILCSVKPPARFEESWNSGFGDNALAEAAQCLRGAVRNYDAVGRIGYDDFAVFLVGCDAAKVADRVAKLEEVFAANEYVRSIPLRIEFGQAVFTPGHSEARAEAMLRAAAVALESMRWTERRAAS